jgi:Pectate lyase superfamily protein
MTSGLILGASTDGTAAKLSDLQDQINALSHAPQLVFVPSFSGPAASTPVSTATFASSQKIDQLTNVTLNNPTINGISGLTAADVPALNYLSLAGGFLSGGLSIGGNLTTTGTAYFTGNLTGANIFGTTSSTTILASGATTPRALGDCAADVINVKSFGAKGNGIADDSAATNAAISYIRNANDAAGGGAMNKYELYFPQGNYLISSTINLTCMSDPNATSGGGLLQDDGCRPNGGSVQVGGNHSVLKIVGDGATISCATTGAPCIDGLGSRYIQIHGLKVSGVCNASEPTWGVQFGMTVAGVGGNDWYFNSVVFTGCYINAAYYNRNSEVMVIDGNSNFQNLDSTHTFATSTGPYVAVWDGGNHWQVTSSFVTTIFTQDAPTTFNDNTVTGSFRSGNSNVGGIWIYGTRRLRFNDSYFISGQGSCVNIYFGASDAGSASTVTDGTPEDAQFDIHCEGTLSKTFLIMGPQSHPIIKNLHYNDHALAPGNASASIFALDPGVTALTLQNVDINMAGTATANTVWDTPSAYTVSGNIYLPANGHTTWTAPGSWKGCVWIGTNCPSCGTLPLPTAL